MAKVSESIKLYTPAGRVWETIGTFGALADWHPLVLACEEAWEGTKRVRKLSLPDADEPLVEREEERDDEGLAYTYSIVEGPMPVAGYRATLRVNRDDAASCTVEWNGEFEASGAPEEDVVALVRDVYRTGLESLKYRLGA